MVVYMQKELPVRKNIRLKDYDYSQNGAYYITICTQDRINLFGDVIVGADLVSARVELNNAGQMIERVYSETVSSFDCIVPENYIIMPNHFHFILSIQRDAERADTRSAPTAQRLRRGGVCLRPCFAVRHLEKNNRPILICNFG